MNLLLQMSLRGTLGCLLVLGLELLFKRRLSAASRRLWWCLAPLAFLFPWRISIPVFSNLALLGAYGPTHVPLDPNIVAPDGAISGTTGASFPWLIGVWAAGTMIYLAMLGVRTAMIGRRWARERLCTEPALIDLLEDCKASMGVTAPIGLVLSEAVGTPSILGWLRPRILLPVEAARALPPAQLRCVLLHELAHFRSADVPINWLFALTNAVHWFNPMSYWTSSRWRIFQEAAADESVLGLLPATERASYAEALLASLGGSAHAPRPWGALGMSESMHSLKSRLKLIQQWRPKRSRWLVSTGGALLLACVVVAQPAAQAAAPDAALTSTVSTIQAWLVEIDQGNYSRSWKDAGATFQGAVTSARWTEQLNRIRTPLGPCTSRKLLSAVHKEDMQKPDGTMLGREMTVALFSTSFANMLGAVETVAFEKGTDGTWRAAGYFIKPAGI